MKALLSLWKLSFKKIMFDYRVIVLILVIYWLIYESLLIEIFISYYNVSIISILDNLLKCGRRKELNKHCGDVPIFGRFLRMRNFDFFKNVLTNTGVKLHSLEPCIFFFTFLMFSDVSIVHFEQVKSGSFLPYVAGPQQWSKSSYALGPAHLSFLQFFSSSNFQSGSFP